MSGCQDTGPIDYTAEMKKKMMAFRYDLPFLFILKLVEMPKTRKKISFLKIGGDARTPNKNLFIKK